MIGQGKKSFYERRPQSRMRINSKAHAGFCGPCGPCSCTPSRRATARVAKSDALWIKLNHTKHKKKTVTINEGNEDDATEETLKEAQN